MATTPVFLPGEFRGKRSLAGYSPWGYKESDMTERQTLSVKKLTYRYKSKTHTSDINVSCLCVQRSEQKIYFQCFSKSIMCSIISKTKLRYWKEKHDKIFH